MTDMKNQANDSIKKEIENYIYNKYKIKPEYPWARYPDYCTFKDNLSGKWFAALLLVERGKLGASCTGKPDEPVYIINVKADTELILMLAGTPGFLPGYHMNKRHWLTIFLDGSVPAGQIKNYIDASYDMITNTPTRRIYEAVKKIPKGRVATYGQVAQMAGNEKMSRAVGNALHKNPDPDGIPCFRVVNSKGELSGEFAFGGKGAQEKLLIEDGVEVNNGRVDLEKYGISAPLKKLFNARKKFKIYTNIKNKEKYHELRRNKKL